MKKLLMLGSSYGCTMIIKYAKEEGYYVIVTDYLPPEHSAAKRLADEYWMISTADLDALEKKCREVGINAVMAGVSEFNLEKAMELSKRLGLRWYCTEDAWKYGRNKRAFKDACIAVNAPIAKDYFVTDRLSDEELDAIKFPVIVKPIDQVANIGVGYCYNKNEFKDAYQYAKSVSESGNVIVEKMLMGEELFGYYALADGEASLMYVEGMYAQPGQPSNVYSIETTSCNEIEHWIAEIDAPIRRLLKHIGCTNGVAWVQAMVDSDGHFYLVEMGYRMASDLVFVPFEKVGGFNLVKWMVDYSMGKKWKPEDLPVSQTAPFRRCACSYMLFNLKEGKIGKIEGIQQLFDDPELSIEIIRSEGDVLEGCHPIANILFDSDDGEMMCQTIQRINDTVRILDTYGENMIIYYDNFDFLKDTYNKNLRNLNQSTIIK